MEETKIIHETAKLAKDKGFNIGNDNSECYDEDGNVTRAGHLNYNQICYRPTQVLVAKWLREEKYLDVEVRLCYGGGYYVSVFNTNSEHQLKNNIPSYVGNIENPISYEEALEEGLQEALKLIKLPKDLQVSE